MIKMDKICSVCSSSEDLQEHHICYDPEEKITLCKKCHKKRHLGHGVGCARGKGSKGISKLSKLEIPNTFKTDWNIMTYKQLEEKYEVCFATMRTWANTLKIGRKRIVRRRPKYIFKEPPITRHFLHNTYHSTPDFSKRTPEQLGIKINILP